VSGAPLLLADALVQFRELTIVSDESRVAALRRLGFPESALLDAAQIRRLSEATGGWTAVTGNIMATGGRVRISAQALDVATARVMARAERDLDAGADVRAAFDDLAVRLLEVAGLPRQSSDVAARTTRSLDAYQAYVRGIGLLRQSAFVRATEEFTRAVRLDSTFALAWARLAMSSAAWNLMALANPLSPAYRASARATALSSQLPPRLAAAVRAQQSFFSGELGAARAVVDSLIASDPNDLDALEFRTLLEMLDPVLVPGSQPPRLRGSPNLAIRMARDLLERDPGRAYLHAVPSYMYGIAGGLVDGTHGGVRREGGSFGALLLAPREARFVPVLRDTFELVSVEEFDGWPDAERRSYRLAAAQGGMSWVRRWLVASPGDADAHLWASRMLSLADSLEAALYHAVVAESLRVETVVENIGGRRVMLLVMMGRLAEAGALADSLAAAGSLPRPPLQALDRGYSYGVAALLLTRRFARAAELLRAGGAPRTGCSVLAEALSLGGAMAFSEQLLSALADLSRTHGAEMEAFAELRPCRELLAR
jgi:hypothetical protein